MYVRLIATAEVLVTHTMSAVCSQRDRLLHK